MENSPGKSFIYDFTNYREFLREYYNRQKARVPAFSYRYFAQKAGFNSSGLYKDIVEGRTGIARGVIHKFSRAMKLTRRQEEYFECMVYFNEARTIEEKNLYFERMMKYYVSKARLVDASQYEYYSKWYYVAVRELLGVRNFKESDYPAIARSLRPRIQQKQAKRALEVLRKLGLIQKNKNGFYKSSNSAITSGPEVKSLNVSNFQREMSDRAKEAIDSFSADERNISSLTFSISEQGFEDITTELDACRKRIITLIKRSENENRVCQLNLQLFPLSVRKEER